MRLFDADLAKMADTEETITITGKPYYIKSNTSGSCDGCSFFGQKQCPGAAVTICTSNGGNILVEKELDKE